MEEVDHGDGVEPMSNPRGPARFHLAPRRPPTPETVIRTPRSTTVVTTCRSPRRVAGAAFALWLAALPAPSGAQETPAPSVCAGGRVSAVFVDNKSIFDVDDLEDAAVGWAYGLANRLHIKTRAGFIRRELLFEEGDCYDPLLLEESGRILRSYAFIARADVFAVDQPDGSVHVVVDTQDEWTTKVDLGVSFDNGLRFEALDLTEENLLGRGILASAFIRQQRERRDRGVRLQFPRVFGTRLDAAGGAGETRIGRFYEASVTYPFVGEVGRFALRQSFRRRDELFPYALPEADAYSDVLLPLLDERAEVSAAFRVGEPGNLTMFGLGFSRETLQFRGFPGDVDVARDRDFENTVPAPADYVDAIRLQTRATSTTRVNFLLGQRNLRFLRVRGLDPLDGDQDIRLGTDVGLTLGRSLGVFPAGDLEDSDDLYTRVRIFVGHDPGTSYVFANLGLEARRLFSGEVDGRVWRDVIGEFDLYGYIRSRRLPGHTFFARVSAVGGWDMNTPFQLTLGGRTGVRGFREEDHAGAHRLLLTLEDRIFVRWPVPDLFDLGFTIFGDVGQMWAGDVPFGRSSGWKGTVGGGLRIGFPAGSRTVARFDLAVPVGSGIQSGPVLRISLFEPLGVITSFFDPQAERSRRITVGPDFFVTEAR